MKRNTLCVFSHLLASSNSAQGVGLRNCIGAYISILFQQNKNEPYTRERDLNCAQRFFACLLQTAGFEVFANERDISTMGMVLTLGTLFLLAIVWANAKHFYRGHDVENTVQGKIIDRYVQTGRVSRSDIANNYQWRPTHHARKQLGNT